MKRSPEETKKLIGQAIRDKRKVLKISQNQLAQMIGIRRVTITDIENGKYGTLDTFLKICNKIELTLAEIGNSKKI